jgi:hypothetical protein
MTKITNVTQGTQILYDMHLQPQYFKPGETRDDVEMSEAELVDLKTHPSFHLGEPPKAPQSEDAASVMALENANLKAEAVALKAKADEDAKLIEDLQKEVAELKAAAEKEDDDTDEAREKLKAEAVALEIDFRKNISTAKLQELVDAKKAEAI